MVVQHNISAMTANRYYGTNNSALGKSLEKLSSGYAINRAGDNAAGLAVSEKMRAQIAGLTQASKNAQDGISMVQTYEGALQETDSILQRMRTIAVQSANGSYQNDVDRDALQLEFDQLNDELNQIADTDFNGVVVLNGGVMADGTVANDTSKIAERPDVKEIKTSPNAAFTYSSSANGTVDSGNNGTLTINGVSLSLKGGVGSATLGSASSGGKTTYSTNDIEVSNKNGKAVVNGTISANETYKINEDTTSITIHGQTYSVGADGLKDSNGDSVGFIDGMQVTVGSEKVELNGTYFVTDSKVTEGTAFNTTVNGLGVSGALDSENNGKVLVGSVELQLKEGATEAAKTVGKLNYEASDFEVKDVTDNGETYSAVEGKVTIKGDFDVTETTTTDGVTVTGTAGTTTVTNAAGTNTETLNYTKLDLSTYGLGTVYTKDGSKFIKADDFEALSADPTKKAADYGTAEVEAGALDSTGKYSTITIEKTNDPLDGSTAGSYKVTLKQNQATLNNGVKVTLNKNKDKILSTTPSADGKTGSISKTTTENDTVTSSGIVYKISSGALKVDMEVDTGKVKVDEGDTVGSFKVSQGVSTSDTFNHGTANLTFADNMTLQVGSRSKDAVTFNFSYTTNGIGNLKSDLNASARGLGTDQVSVRNQEDANAAIDAIDNAINKVSMIRGTFGAIQNRLEHKINNIDTNAENLTAAESRIRDTQMDQEMMKFTSAQILSQASQSMLAQANSLPQGVLQLLG